MTKGGVDGVKDGADVEKLSVSGVLHREISFLICGYADLQM